MKVSADELLFDEDERAPSDDLKLQFEAVSRFPEEEKRIVKLDEQHEQLSKSVHETYRYGFNKYGENFRKHPDFQDDFNLIGEWEVRKEKIRKSIRRVEEKHGLDWEQVVKKHRVNQMAKGYGGSF